MTKLTTNTLLLVGILAVPLSACQSPTTAQQGLQPVHVPVVSTSQYVWDAAVSGDSLSPQDAGRLDGWFAGLGLDYGDRIYVSGDFSPYARSQIEQIAGNYGLLISPGIPASAGASAPGLVRVVVSRTKASVPGCPDWSQPSSPNFNNASMSNFGCGVNSNLAMQVADSQDLLHGRPGQAAEDAQAAAKAIIMYRNWPHTALREGQAQRPLQASNTSSIKENK